MPAVIFWDIMDTLVRDPFFTHMAEFFGHSFEQLRSKLRPGTWVEFELGKLEETEFYARFFRDGSPIDGEGLKRCMSEAYRWIDGVEPLLAELKQCGVQMHALSNYPSWYRLIDQRLGLAQYVELSFISCHTGVRKPDPKAFLEACAAIQRAPSDCLLVDDRAVNCDAARAVGLATHQFTGDVAALRRVLDGHGFLSPR
jgi:FMN hydrolase / 5-amino-6-(5-phospho-D-ribitylamino)uracil phosphatase